MQSYADQPGQPLGGFVSTVNLALWTCLLLGAMALIQGLEFGANLLQILLHALYPETVRTALAQIAEGEFQLTNLPGGILQMLVLMLSGFVGLLYFLFLIITAIVFLVWLSRAYKNLRPLGVEPQYSTGWVIGSWFVPLLNLVRPFQIVKELWLESDPDNLPAEGAAEPVGFGGTLDQIRANVPLLNAWWFFWISGTAASRVSARLAQDIANVEDYIFGCKVQLIPALLLTVAGVLAIFVVRGITTRQNQRHQLLVTRQRTAPQVGNPGQPVTTDFT
jgi:hypothetical protein